MLDLMDHNTTMEDIEKETLDSLNYYRKYPEDFKDQTFVSGKFTPKQSEVFNALFQNKRVLVASCHNFGKTFIAANAVMTAMQIYGDQLTIITTAPTWRQVEGVLWAEVRKIFKNTNEKKSANINGKIHPFLAGDMASTHYKIADDWIAVGFSPKVKKEGDSSVFQGYHNRKVIILFEEATGISKTIWDAAEGMTTSCDVSFWAIFNPTDASAEVARKWKEFGWKKIKVNIFDTPNMIANGIVNMQKLEDELGLLRACVTDEDKEAKLSSYKMVAPYHLSVRWVLESAMKWGINSPMFQSKALANFPTIVKNTLVPLQRMEELMHGTYTKKDIHGNNIIAWISEESGYAKYDEQEIISYGLDMAREGDDKSVLSAFQGNKQLDECVVYEKNYIKTVKGTKLLEDGVHIAGDVKRKLMRHPGKQRRVIIDVTGGYGLGVYDLLIVDTDILNDPTIQIIGISFGAAGEEVSNMTDMQYKDMVTQLWFQLRDDILSPNGLLLFPDEDLQAEVTNRLIMYDNKLRERIESKKEFKLRIGRSPDKADSVALARYGSRYGVINVFKRLAKVGTSSKHFRRDTV